MLILSTLWMLAAAPPHPVRVPPGGTPPHRIAGSISDEDYPAAAAGAEEQGTVRVELDIGAGGEVAGCRVAATSGSAVLDATTCLLIRQRFRFAPARDRRGRAVASRFSQSVAWRLPKDDPEDLAAALTPPFGPWELRITAVQDDLGTRCAVEENGAPPLLVEISCPRQFRVPAAELAGNAQARIVVTRLTPEGGTVTRRPVRGTLVGRMASDLEVRPDGTIGACRDAEVAGPRVPQLPSLCSHTDASQQFARDPEGRTRRGRVEMEFYRTGVPET